MILEIVSGGDERTAALLTVRETSICAPYRRTRYVPSEFERMEAADRARTANGWAWLIGACAAPLWAVPVAGALGF